jgi:hypothetical protein
MYEVSKFVNGLDRNVVIYDADAPKGEMTARLFALMNITARHLDGVKCRIFKWHLPKVVIEEFMEKPSVLFKDVSEYNKYIMGLEFEEQPDDLLIGTKLFAKNGEEIDYKRWIQKDDVHIIIGESDNGEYVIGSC